MRLPLQSRIVTDPDGVRWRVSVRWTPWWPRRRMGGSNGSADTLLEVPDIGPLDDAGGCLFVLVIFFVIFAGVVALPVLLLLLEVALLVVVAVPLVLVLALVGAASWRIEVELEGATDGKRRMLEHHRGIRAADDAIFNLANQIRSGDLRPER